jgi:hypothetical protein
VLVIDFTSPDVVLGQRDTATLECTTSAILACGTVGPVAGNRQYGYLTVA